MIVLDLDKLPRPDRSGWLGIVLAISLLFDAVFPAGSSDPNRCWLPWVQCRVKVEEAQGRRPHEHITYIAGHGNGEAGECRAPTIIHEWDVVHEVDEQACISIGPEVMHAVISGVRARCSHDEYSRLTNGFSSNGHDGTNMISEVAGSIVFIEPTWVRESVMVYGAWIDIAECRPRRARSPM